MSSTGLAGKKKKKASNPNGSGRPRTIFNTFFEFRTFNVDNKVFKDRVAMLASLQMVVFFVVQFTFAMYECPYVASQYVLELRCRTLCDFHNRWFHAPALANRIPTRLTEPFTVHQHVSPDDDSL